MAKVAIIIRSKDRLPFLARALADIAAQTFTDWQALVINDGGDAAGVDALLAAQPSALQEKIAVLHLSQNLGRSGSAQKGLDASDGEYFALHDDDDTWHPAFLARTTAWLEAHPEAAAVAVRTEILHEEADGQGGWRECGREPISPEIHDLSLLELLVVNKAVPIGCLYRCADIRAVGGYNAQLPVVEDWDLHLRLTLQKPFGLIEGETLAYWHHRRGVGGDWGNSMHDLANDHWLYDRRLRDTAMRESLQQAPQLLGLALQSGLHMRNIHEHVARLHTHLEDTRGEMRHLLHENLRKQDALQEQLRYLTHELSQERESTAQARAAARDAQERLLAWTAQMDQANHQAQQERAGLRALGGWVGVGVGDVVDESKSRFFNLLLPSPPLPEGQALLA